jgi:hypothetical protein
MEYEKLEIKYLGREWLDDYSQSLAKYSGYIDILDNQDLKKNKDIIWYIDCYIEFIEEKFNVKINYVDLSDITMRRIPIIENNNNKFFINLSNNYSSYEDKIIIMQRLGVCLLYREYNFKIFLCDYDYILMQGRYFAKGFLMPKNDFINCYKNDIDTGLRYMLSYENRENRYKNLIDLYGVKKTKIVEYLCFE